VRHHLRDISKQLGCTAWCFEPYDRDALTLERRKIIPPFACLTWRKPIEAKRADVKSREDKGGRHGAWSGQRFDRSAALARRADEFSPRVGDARHARIGHHRNGLAFTQQFAQLTQPRFVRTFGERPQWLVDLKMAKQILCYARVFSEDDIALAQRPQGAQRDVFKISERRRTKHELAGRGHDYSFWLIIRCAYGVLAHMIHVPLLLSFDESPDVFESYGHMIIQ